MAYYNTLPLSAILNGSIAKGGIFYEQSKPGDSDNLRRGSLHRREQLSPGGTSGTAGKPETLLKLLQGLEIEQKKALWPVKRSSGSTCF